MSADKNARDGTALIEHTLYIPPRLWEVLTYLARERKLEWQCFGKVERISPTEHKLVDIKFPKQTNTGAGTETSEKDMTDFMTNLLNTGEDLADYRLWIHSHNTMAAFWSSTDYDQMERQKNSTYMMNLVVNARKEYQACINIWQPVRANVVMRVREADGPVPQDELEAINKQVDELEQRPTYTPQTYSYGNRYADPVYCDECFKEKYRSGYCASCQKKTNDWGSETEKDMPKNPASITEDADDGTYFRSYIQSDEENVFWGDEFDRLQEVQGYADMDNDTFDLVMQYVLTLYRNQVATMKKGNGGFMTKKLFEIATSRVRNQIDLEEPEKLIERLSTKQLSIIE